jgi:hypothetical protein
MAYGLVSDAFQSGSPHVRSFVLFSPHLKSQITSSHSRPRRFHHHQFSDEEQPRWAYFRHPGMTCDLGSCVLCFLSPYPEIIIPVSPRYEVEKGAPFDTTAHVRSRGISGNSCALRSRFSDTRLVLIVLLLSFRLFEANISCLGGLSIAQHAAVECAARARRLACEAAGPHREYESGLGLDLVTSAEIRYCAGSPFETQISSRSVVGMARLVHDCGSRGPEAAEIRVDFRFVCAVGRVCVCVCALFRTCSCLQRTRSFSPEARLPLFRGEKSVYELESRKCSWRDGTQHRQHQQLQQPH